VPLEIYELTQTVSPFKVIALVVNLALVISLLYAKRPLGVRCGPAADESWKLEDVGWGSLERTGPDRFSPGVRPSS
jgi:hypothetical protein